MIITINVPDNLVDVIKQIINIITVILTIFGGSAAAVKLTGTLPQGSVFLPLIKFLGRLTNNMSKDEEIRAQQALAKGEQK